MARPTFPGSTWPPEKTMMLRRNSVTSDSEMRLRRKLRMTGPSGCGLKWTVAACRREDGGPRFQDFIRSRLGGAVEEDLRHRRRIDAGHALRGRRQIVEEITDDHRRFLQQQALDLAGVCLLGLEVEGRDIARRQRIVFGVLEVCRVPG